jgi:hypothetical protein
MTASRKKADQQFINRTVSLRGLSKVSLAPNPLESKPEKRQTVKERTHHESSTHHAAYVQTTNKVPKLLRRLKARTGSHVEQFQKDYELVGSDLRSASLDGAGGGGVSTPFPLAKVQAADRLKSFEANNEMAFRMCEAVLIHNETPQSIHQKGGPQHVVVSHMIREAIEDLAEFYTPQRKRPDKLLALIVKVVDDARRRSESSRP